MWSERLDRYHRLTHIFLERFKQEEAEEHGVIEGGVGHEALERQLLESEILERPVHQFVRAPLVVGVDDGIGFGHEREASLLQLLIHDTIHAKVGVDDGAWS